MLSVLTLLTAVRKSEERETESETDRHRVYVCERERNLRERERDRERERERDKGERQIGEEISIHIVCNARQIILANGWQESFESRK